MFKLINKETKEGSKDLSTIIVDTSIYAKIIDNKGILLQIVTVHRGKFNTDTNKYLRTFTEHIFIEDITVTQALTSLPTYFNVPPII